MGVTNHPLWLRSELAREQCRLAGDLSIREQARSYYRRFKAGVAWMEWSLRNGIQVSPVGRAAKPITLVVICK